MDTIFNTMPTELINKIIMLQIPTYKYHLELKHFGWSSYQTKGDCNCSFCYDDSDSDSDDDEFNWDHAQQFDSRYKS